MNAMPVPCIPKALLPGSAPFIEGLLFRTYHPNSAILQP